ncbi:MAG TPA: pectate lyase [Bacteroidales bacterium]|nr:pectate lyase [Bacteroidales bacterium]
MYTKRFIVPILLFAIVSTIQAQTLRNAGGTLFQDSAWYGTPQSLHVASNVLLLQHDNGGWPKNIKFYKDTLSADQITKYQAEKEDPEETTIDNGATYSEMLFVAKMYQATKDCQYKTAFLKGLSFLHSLQYANGGFKQFARNKGYYTHITFNDNAMLNAMLLMNAIAVGNPLFAGITEKKDQAEAKASFEKGLDCILKTQYVQNGRKTVWCAQHDEKTLLPAKARAYELPSLSGSESVGLVQLLMDLKNPSKAVKEAVEGAIAWFEATRIHDHRVQLFTNAEGKLDRRWVESTEGNDLWARFYELDTNKPFVCDRDGIIKYDLSEIGYERRNGYGWYTDTPLKVLEKYLKWKKING